MWAYKGGRKVNFSTNVVLFFIPSKIEVSDTLLREYNVLLNNYVIQINTPNLKQRKGGKSKTVFVFTCPLNHSDLGRPEVSCLPERTLITPRV